MKKVYYAFSDIGGSGIFARNDIKRDEIVFRVLGKNIIHHRYTPKFSPSCPNWIGIGKETWLVPKSNNPWHYINHYCNPNVGFRGELTIVAMRNIKADEEITIDYAITEEDPYWHMLCHCGAVQCRKNITSAAFVPHLLEKYQSYLPNFLKPYLYELRNNQSDDPQKIYARSY